MYLPGVPGAWCPLSVLTWRAWCLMPLECTYLACLVPVSEDPLPSVWQTHPPEAPPQSHTRGPPTSETAQLLCLRQDIYPGRQPAPPHGHCTWYHSALQSHLRLTTISGITLAILQCMKLNFLSTRLKRGVPYIDGLMQERLNSIANALELHLSFINPTICSVQNSTHPGQFSTRQAQNALVLASGQVLVSRAA